MPEEKMSETDYLNNYDITSFDRPSVAVDIALFSILKEKNAENLRKLDENELKILLIKRGSHPDKERWALPGGFCLKYEDVKEAAIRELREETNISNAYMQLISAFGEKGRDPRGWIISNTFLAIADGNQCIPHAGSDAWESAWFTVKLTSEKMKCTINKEDAHIIMMHHISFINKEKNISLNGMIKEEMICTLNSEQKSYQIVMSDMAFDHVKIITIALLRLRKELIHDRTILFNIMPKSFTMQQLHEAFELILDTESVKGNFYRDMSKYVVETGEISSGKMHRAAKMYQHKIFE